ncbi:glucose-6-phosphate isomerase [Cryptosporidium ryanae]|uniref:glucose-6-phosphate isomerase n=1 Tax=Cryptosporidium ryanae TaxID=515981 RepID=UPI00351A7617|nr:glucose-6-phosphate isomerase [Cryptosporidium ryanae]
MPELYELPSFTRLQEYAKRQKCIHLRDLLKNEVRNSCLYVNYNGIMMDFTRQHLDEEGFKLLIQLATESDLMNKIKQQIKGEIMNTTENRSVLHTALRSKSTIPIILNSGQSVLSDINEVNRRIFKFANAIRKGEILGSTGKILKDIICIGIGGSYLGPEFLYEALRTTSEGSESSSGRRLRFLANVDPIDVKRATEGLHPETTLVIIVSKTFTTMETILNAKTIKDWLHKVLKSETAVSKHLAAVSTNIKATSEFGVPVDHVFGFWDWVGGRFSVCSAVGLLPLSIHFGVNVIQDFLDGCSEMDQHFENTPVSKNLPVILGLIGIFNSVFMDKECVALLPYCQALCRFPAHVQQLTMESNGKSSSINGVLLQDKIKTGAIYFGEPGTNSQHSFYQLLHQGRNATNCEFIGFVNSQCDSQLLSEPISNHDELMSNFFAQPDALAIGKSQRELNNEECPEILIPHRIFQGNRSSISILFPVCDAFYLGQLLALYEHRTAVEGYILNINSFDQYGVELGKVLAKDIRSIISMKRTNASNEELSIKEDKLPGPTRRMIDFYIKNSPQNKI